MRRVWARSALLACRAAQCWPAMSCASTCVQNLKTFNPALVDDDSSETVRYLTGGVLVRLNRQTQHAEPELATAWKVSKDARSAHFQLRQGVRFSDGSAL